MHSLTLNPLARAEQLPRMLSEVDQRDSFCVDRRAQAIEELRVAIRDKTKATTTFGYGPRYLHSTGQFHKGGPATGVFIQLIDDGDEDIEIPEAGHSFRTLKNAQAQGDYETLKAHDLPVTRVVLSGDPAKAVRDLIKAL